MSLFTPSPSHCPEHHLRSRPPTAWCMHYCLCQHAPLRAAPHPKLSDPSLRVLGALPPLVPLMIWDFFHERHKVRAGAEAVYRLVERATRPFGRADLDFDASAEGYYKSSTGPEGRWPSPRQYRSRRGPPRRAHAQPLSVPLTM
ncbi:hypothetical protein BC826DRAFT_1009941 [Russula brevipes]|nr:hypothetical protein BC826DRAFT_1037090 [Russula brevipes]KAI0290494.1 hypothetical protein BC826DRAFT_1026757 [Russula brevipes]KAI0295005.1 hypothetical protein BC826DRAFT_1009941 [Russula brevipes]